MSKVEMDWEEFKDYASYTNFGDNNITSLCPLASVIGFVGLERGVLSWPQVVCLAMGTMYRIGYNRGLASRYHEVNRKAFAEVEQMSQSSAQFVNELISSSRSPKSIDHILILAVTAVVFGATNPFNELENIAAIIGGDMSLTLLMNFVIGIKQEQIRKYLREEVATRLARVQQESGQGPAVRDNSIN